METLSSHFQGIPGGIVMSLIAFSIVFIALSGLCLIIYGVKFVAAAADASARAKKDTKGAKADAPKGTPVVQAVAVSPAPAPAAPVEDENLLAVIGAAIAATLGGGFAVRSVRPVAAAVSSTVGMWKGSARIETMEGL
jgi:Na+-transporting methylmalonyl-CoA/oxaloacetate decarboxylase gamma subunit